MAVEDFSSIKIAMLVLLPVIAVIAQLGNGLVLCVVARFKKLRTFRNILIANLALADFFNALINIPMYLLWGVLSVEWFKGKALAIISLFLFHLFILLNLVSMLVLLENVFLAIALELKYFTWKTNEKAMIIVLVVWLVSLIAASSFTWLNYDIDLQDAPVSRYRQAFSTKSQYFVTAVMAAFIIAAIVFGVLAFCSIQRKKRQRKQLNLPRLQAESRLQQDIQAAKTVALTVLAFLACYVPPVCIRVGVRPKTDTSTIPWPGHVAYLSMFLSSAINPIFYCFRVRRFRHTLKQLFHDPCGKKPFQETINKQRARQNIPRQNANRVGVVLREFEKEEKREHKDNECGIGAPNQFIPLSLQEQQSQRSPRLAWVENHHG